MELRHLRYFVAAAEERNISRASRRLYVSQPAMSRLIHDLEDEMGAALFTREPFGLRLTPAGEKLLEYARRILDLAGEAARAVKSETGAATQLKVGFIASSLGSFLGDALRAFRARRPEVTVLIHELSPAEQVKALRKHQIDIALIGNPCDAVEVEFDLAILYEMDLQAVIPESHRLAAEKEISLKDLATETFIGYNEESFPGRSLALLNACRQAGFRPELSARANSLVEVLAMVGSGAGVCLMPSDVVSLPHPHTVLVQVRENLEPIRFAAAWRRDDRRPVLKDLLDAMREGSAGKGRPGMK
ncbi:MAG: LysR family transcriptional regulator [Acidobacteria bacterium]|nr:LysR family transcriptional regulator [Acidobacteriota bacterium]